MFRYLFEIDGASFGGYMLGSGVTGSCRSSILIFEETTYCFVMQLLMWYLKSRAGCCPCWTPGSILQFFLQSWKLFQVMHGCQRCFPWSYNFPRALMLARKPLEATNQTWLPPIPLIPDFNSADNVPGGLWGALASAALGLSLFSTVQSPWT